MTKKPFSVEDLLKILRCPAQRNRVMVGRIIGFATPESTTIIAIASGRTLKRSGRFGYEAVDGVHFKTAAGETCQTTLGDFVARYGASFNTNAALST